MVDGVREQGLSLRGSDARLLRRLIPIRHAPNRPPRGGQSAETKIRNPRCSKGPCCFLRGVPLPRTSSTGWSPSSGVKRDSENEAWNRSEPAGCPGMVSSSTSKLTGSARFGRYDAQMLPIEDRNFRDESPTRRVRIENERRQERRSFASEEFLQGPLDAWCFFAIEIKENVTRDRHQRICTLVSGSEDRKASQPYSSHDSRAVLIESTVRPWASVSRTASEAR